MKSFIRTMKALSDPNRVRVLKLLEREELCGCEIQHVLGLAQSTVSKHLKTLEEAGLVTARKEGRWHYYRLEPEGPYGTVMLEHLLLWHNEDADLRRMIVELEHVDRRHLCSSDAVASARAGDRGADPRIRAARSDLP